MEKQIAVLGSTGSVGCQALDVAWQLHYPVTALVAGGNIHRLEAQIRRFKPRLVGVKDEEKAKDLRVRVADLDVKLVSGEECAQAVAAESVCDTVVNAVTGIAGLAPTVAALESGKHVALANKETMVAYGDAVMALAREKGKQVLPVDSEHCAIFQCLQGNETRSIARLLLTASGGPFYDKPAKEMAGITPTMALAHPTWKMGRRIAIDSATLMNKGFEVIEAVRLFGVSPEQVEVLIHRESIIHSLVEYTDRAVMAQLSVPDMRLCVQYALSYPARGEGVIDRLDLAEIGQLSFASPDLKKFPLLALSWRAMEKGGVVPAVMNAADETAVALFLDGKLPFTGISELVKAVTDEARAGEVFDLPAVMQADAMARERTAALAKELFPPVGRRIIVHGRESRRAQARELGRKADGGR